MDTSSYSSNSTQYRSIEINVNDDSDEVAENIRPVEIDINVQKRRGFYQLIGLTTSVAIAFLVIVTDDAPTPLEAVQQPNEADSTTHVTSCVPSGASTLLTFIGYTMIYWIPLFAYGMYRWYSAELNRADKYIFKWPDRLLTEWFGNDFDRNTLELGLGSTNLWCILGNLPLILATALLLALFYDCVYEEFTNYLNNLSKYLFGSAASQ